MTPAVNLEMKPLAESEQFSRLFIRHFQRRKIPLIFTSGAAIALPDAIEFVAFSDIRTNLRESLAALKRNF